MSELTFYETPACTTCRRTAKLPAERGVDFERVNCYVDPFGEDKLRELLRKRSVLRPIVERGDRAVLARPPERVLELLD